MTVGPRCEEHKDRTMWLFPALLLLSFPGCLSIQGPASVRGPEQGSVTVQCHYSPRWKTYNKWWCRGANWNTCNILIQTTRLEKEKKAGRLSIRDNWRDYSFQVTMEKLKQDDTDTYWCGIEKTGTDRGTRIIVTVDPVGKSTMSSSKLPARPTVNNSTSMESSGSYKRTHYVLLGFVKVPALLILAGVVLWLKGPRRDPEEQWGQPLYRTSDSELLTKDMAP